MAGDWIKVEHATLDKPEVYQIAAILKTDPDAVLGKLLRFWCWADTQSRDGHALSVTLVTVDTVSRCPGLGEAMQKVGWIKGEDWNLSVPNFDRHNGKSAKSRGLAYNRKQRERRAKTSRSKRDGNAPETETENYPPTPQQRDDRTALLREQNPSKVSELCRKLGLGDPPAGMGTNEAKQWAISRLKQPH